MNKNRNYRINSKIVTLGVLAVVLLVNVFVTLLVKKLPIKLDLTSEGLYEISAETKDMLKAYDTPVDIYFVTGSGVETSYKEFGNIAQILEKYGQYGKSVKYTTIDGYNNPTFGNKYANTGESVTIGSVIVDSGKKHKVYQYTDLYNISTNQQGSYLSSIRAEQKINAALRVVSDDTVLNAYVLTGHNEKNLSGLTAKLTDEGYNVNTVNLTTEEIPSDASMVAIFAPTIDYTDAEIAKLDNYLSNSGKAYIAFDYTSTGLSKLYTYLTSWGISVNDDVAVEADSSYIVNQLGIVLADYAENDIVKSLKDNNRYIGYSPYSKSLTLLFTENGGIKTMPILTTTKKGYSTTDLNELSNTSGNTGVQTIAAVATRAGETPDKDASIYVSGSTMLFDVAEDTHTSFGLANYDYATSVLTYLAGNYEDYSISPKYLSSGYLFMDQLQVLIFGGLFAVVVPLSVLIYGIVIWFKRRNL